MAPNKFENHLKETLDRRTITPSKNAWSQLDARLDNQQSKRKFPFWWIGLAATFTGISLSVFLFNNKVETTNVIVDIDKTQSTKPIKVKISKEEVKVVNIFKTEAKQDIEPKVDKKKSPSIKENIKVVTTVISTKKEEQLLIEANGLNSDTVATVNVARDTVSNTVAEIKVLNDEVDILLNEAYADVKENKSIYKSEKIDANSLLEEIEMTSEKSLKNRLFHAVKSGYETLRTTVVERNY